jgi:hypothetical protein
MKYFVGNCIADRKSLLKSISLRLSILSTISSPFSLWIYFSLAIPSKIAVYSFLLLYLMIPNNNNHVAQNLEQQYGTNYIHVHKIK